MQHATEMTYILYLILLWKLKQFHDSFVVMWWWIIWHLYWEFGHIIGEFDYPDVAAWTDAELGIPPDDEE